MMSSLRAGDTWDHTSLSQFKSHQCAAQPIFPKAKLNRGREKKKVYFPPQNALIPLLRGYKTCSTQGRPCQLSVPFKRERGKMENGFFSNIQAVICVRPAKLLFYRSPWQVLSRRSLTQPVWISPALLWSPWNLDEQNSLRQIEERCPLVPENSWCARNMFFSARQEGKQELNTVMRMIKNNG